MISSPSSSSGGPTGPTLTPPDSPPSTSTNVHAQTHIITHMNNHLHHHHHVLAETQTQTRTHTYTRPGSPLVATIISPSSSQAISVSTSTAAPIFDTNTNKEDISSLIMMHASPSPPSLSRIASQPSSPPTPALASPVSPITNERKETSRERSMDTSLASPASSASAPGSCDLDHDDSEVKEEVEGGSRFRSGSASVSVESSCDSADSEDGDGYTFSLRSRLSRPISPTPSSNSSSSSSDSPASNPGSRDQDQDPETDMDMDIESYTDLPEITYALRIRAEPVFVRPGCVGVGAGVSGENIASRDEQLDMQTQTQQAETITARTGTESIAPELKQVHFPTGVPDQQQQQQQQQQRWPLPNSTSYPKPADSLQQQQQRRPKLTLPPLRLPSTRRAPVTSRVFPLGVVGQTRSEVIVSSTPVPILGRGQVPVLFTYVDPNSKDHNRNQPQPQTQELAQPQAEENACTPNVYINGLPPQYPESELYTLTCTYGEVRSVRTFTRHVCGRASGYGFVLFDTVEAAVKCIDALRHYRNLHPSFSKQIHKIPGTLYAPSSSSGSASPLGGTRSFGNRADFENGVTADGDDDETFKARMEKLSDKSSTNLYFEGLPLSIDEPTLAALVSPFAIKSSRFFQTKLSDPPRIIAFVRLETREAAEEIIERLHGRMVRGWNEPGCRISVRFADSAEQREMRRTERNTREEEPSPKRLTIAQAALLNLRGQDLQQQQQLQPLVLDSRHHRPTLPIHNSDDFKVKPHSANRYYPNHADGHALSSNAVSQPRDLLANFNPDMANILESMRAGQVLSDGYSGAHAQHARARAAALAAYRAQPPPPPAHVPMAMSVQAQTQTRSGFTLAEERILQSHETGHHPYQQQQQQQTRLVGDTAPRAHSAFSRPRSVNTVRQGPPYAQPPFPPRISPGFSPIAPTNMMSEDDFHASAQDRHHISSYQRPHHYQIDMADGNTIEGPSDFSPSSPSDFPYSNNNNHDRLQQHNEAISSDQNSKYQASQAHVRSTTLPSSPFNQRPYHSRQHYSSSSFPPSSSDNLSRARSNNYINTGNHNNNQEHNNSNSTNQNHIPRHNDDHIINSNNYDSTHFHTTLQTIHDDSESPLVSPSLTYSSRTPSTLSPATPFFGSFAHAQENFKGHVQENFEGFGSGPQGEKQVRMDSR